MQFVPTPKNTPNRRRPPPGRSRSGAQKVYASENDVPSYKPDNTVSPSTPLKHTPQSQSTSQKQKNKGNKSRSAKGGVASPGRRQDRDSPSLPPQLVSGPIFAGSTFHASPAPSALPLPSFLGLSNADSPSAQPKATESAYESSPLTDSDEGTPAEDPVPRNDESPLEFFFRADRAEKARGRRASSANTDGITTASFSPLQSASHKDHDAFPKAMAQSAPRRPMFFRGGTSPSISTNELHEGSRPPVGPAFSTPYQERIRAARSTENSAQPSPVVNRNLDPNSSAALKRYLFTGQLQGPKPLEPPQYSRPSSDIHPIVQQRPRSRNGQQRDAHQASLRSPLPTSTFPRGVFPASVLGGHAPRTQPNPPIHTDAETNPRPENILALEGDLRRLLKLDPLR